MNVNFKLNNFLKNISIKFYRHKFCSVSLAAHQFQNERAWSSGASGHVVLIAPDQSHPITHKTSLQVFVRTNRIECFF